MFTDYLLKPIPLNTLLAYVAKYLPHKIKKRNVSDQLQFQISEWRDINKDKETNLLQAFNEQVVPLAKNIEITLALDKVESLAKILENLGNNYNFEPFASYSKKLLEYQQSIDIENILIMVHDILSFKMN